MGATLDIDLVAVDTVDEVAVLLELAARGRVAEAVCIVIRPADSVPAFTLWNDLPVSGSGDGVVAELGDLHAGERRRILLGFQVPTAAALGVAAICELELRWTDPASTTEKIATMPVSVNLEAARRDAPARVTMGYAARNVASPARRPDPQPSAVRGARLSRRQRGRGGRR